MPTHFSFIWTVSFLTANRYQVISVESILFPREFFIPFHSKNLSFHDISSLNDVSIVIFEVRPSGRHQHINPSFRESLNRLCSAALHSCQRTLKVLLDDFTGFSKIVQQQWTKSPQHVKLNDIETHRNQSLCCVFPDEVQRVEGWAGASRTLRIRNCSVFIMTRLITAPVLYVISGSGTSCRWKNCACAK